MLLLNLQAMRRFHILIANLHFNMLLLNLAKSAMEGLGIKIFTFQYASIKPRDNCKTGRYHQRFTFQYASIKPYNTMLKNLTLKAFTFQYASIKPDKDGAISVM